MRTYLFEAQGMNVSAGGARTTSNYSVGVMLHTGYSGRTYNPDWVQLAAFLIGANPNSYFSYSAGWDIDDFPVLPEFTRPLGAPLGPPTVSRNETLLPAWATISSLNVVFSLPPSPGGNATNALFLGRVDSPQACAALAEASGVATAFTHTLGSGDEWDRTCYARTDEVPIYCFTEGGASLGPPCWSAFSTGHASGSAQRVPGAVEELFAREFEHCSVRLTLNASGSWGATLGWH
jgi:hypothetical protein